MNLDDILKLIAALGLGSVGGTIAGSISGGIAAVWTARRDKQRQLDDTRRERLATWRAELRDPVRRKAHITAIPSWPEIRAFVDKEMVEKIEKPTVTMVGGPTQISMRPRVAQPQTTYHRVYPWDHVLAQLADVERAWGLM